MVRVIGHFDLDYFYAQVEEVEDPSLKTRPVIVCVFSGRTEESGVVSTANYIARRFGAGSGMPIAQAKRRLEGTNAAVIKMDHAKYELVSERIMRVVRERVDVLEETGIDEAFFDVTRASSGDFRKGERIAEQVKRAVLGSERLTCSVGLGRTKVVAKIASDFKKPDGLTVVIPESTEAFLSPLPVIKLYGVGPKTTAALSGMGVSTIGELAAAPLEKLESVFGRKTAVYLHSAASGTDAEPVHEAGMATQLSRIVTLKADTRDADAALRELEPALDDLWRRLSESGVSFRTVSAIAILTDLSTKTKSKTLENPVNDRVVLEDQTRALMKELSGSVQLAFRRVGVRVSDLIETEDQTSLTQYFGGA